MDAPKSIVDAIKKDFDFSLFNDTDQDKLKQSIEAKVQAMLQAKLEHIGTGTGDVTGTETVTTINPKGGAGEKFNPFDFIPDTWDRADFMECWTAHMEVRRKKKNPASPKACELMLKELVRVCPVWSDARSKMESAIISGWPKYIYEDSGRTAKVIRPREKQQADYKGGFGQL